MPKSAKPKTTSKPKPTPKSTLFDMAVIQRGARLRRSPYFDATLRAGCRGYTIYNHMFLPIAYDDLEREYWKLLNHVTVWDVAVERQVEITGRDAFAFTSLLTPRDLTQCAVGQGKYVVITAEDGGIINDPVLLRLGENHFWLALADSDVLLWAKGVAYRSGMDVMIREPDVSPMQIQGPKSKQVLEKLFGPRVLDMAYYHFFEAKLDGIPVIVTRTGWTGEVGYEIYLRDGSRGGDLWDRVLDAGKPFGIAPTGPSDIRRIEAGILNYGIDMTLENNPYEVGLGWLVDLEQEADFIGKEALRRIKAEGVRRKLVGVEIAGPQLDLNMTRWPVRQGGETVGFVTSAVYSPRLKKNIGYANLPLEHAALGTTLLADAPPGEASLTVVRKPFVDPEKEIPKG
ncbi:MAG TPA: glycine cleavage T C-terminal barrel domain-containing protein [Gemmatimonadales bacterium]|nr:glycine cleavage T C-terminal barrel domain-containing protein [Gemmatimonadales bacterium]